MSYYGIWHGKKVGITDSWSQTQELVKGVKGAVFRKLKATELTGAYREFLTDSFFTDKHQLGSLMLKAFKEKINLMELPKNSSLTQARCPAQLGQPQQIVWQKDHACIKQLTQIGISFNWNYEPKDQEVLCVDGAANNGVNFEFQGVWYPSGTKAFVSGVFKKGSNNVAEFLALSSALMFLSSQPLVNQKSVYTDSVTAMAWVRDGVVKSDVMQSEQRALIGYINEHLMWLKNNKQHGCLIKKWESAQWGENPADYGRK